MEKLVSVIVATYNSELYVLETLESIFNQTYQNIQLIVSDDCSKDNSVGIIEKWCDQDRVKKRFVAIKIITVPYNTGVSANCNRSIKASASEWIKIIAGDDILLPNCISDNMTFVANNPKANIVFSQVKVYQDTFLEANYKITTPIEFPVNLMKELVTAQDQYKLLLVSDRIHYTPSYFFNKIAIEKVSYYDETNRLVEDYPMWLKLTKSGERLYYFHKVTVGYRIHSKATNNSGENVLFKPSVINSHQVRKKYAHPNLPFEIVYSEYHIYWVSMLFSRMNWNKKTKLLTGMYRICCYYLNPFQYFYALKKRLPANKHNTFYF